jgi:hypothetical protein
MLEFILSEEYNYAIFFSMSIKANIKNDLQQKIYSSFLLSAEKKQTLITSLTEMRGIDLQRLERFLLKQEKKYRNLFDQLSFKQKRMFQQRVQRLQQRIKKRD